MQTIETDRLLLRPFTQEDYDDLYEFLSQRRNDQFEAYPGITRDPQGDPVWQDTLVYALLEKDFRKIGR